MEELDFTSAGLRCAGWHYPAETEDLAGPAGRPGVVMAHGFGHTRDCGLPAYAERFAAAGIDVLLFDYRTFGGSEGEPRRLVDFKRHREDYRAALVALRSVGGVDAERIAAWGSSYSGGHVIAVAAEDERVAAVVAQVPATDGLAVLRQLVSYAGVGTVLKASARGMADLAGSAVGLPPVRIPLVGPPGSVAAMTTPDAVPGSQRIQGPAFQNDCCARALALVPLNRAVRRARDVRCPVLVQVAEQDAITPPAAAERAAAQAPLGEVRRYPGGHFDLYTGEGFERAVTDQLEFLTRHLTPRRAGSVRAAA